MMQRVLRKPLILWLSFSFCLLSVLIKPALAQDADLTEPSAAIEENEQKESAFQEEPSSSSNNETAAPLEMQENTDHQKKSKSYNVRLSLAKPLFNLTYHATLYGDSRFFPTVATEWMLKRSSWMDLGLAFRFGYYNSGGFAAAKPKMNHPSESELVQDSDKTSLTLVPLDISCVARFDLASISYLAFSAWAGYQNMYYQEVRTSQNATTSTSSSDDTSSASYQVSKGWNGSLVFGGSLDLMISQLAPRNRPSLRSMGFGRVFVSPYLEVVSMLGSFSLLGKAGKTDFSRSSIGVAFLFEGL